MNFVTDFSIPPALTNRLMIFDADGQLTFGSPDCIRKLNLKVDVNIATSYPQQWPQFENVMYTGRGRTGLRLGQGDSAIIVDA